MDIVVQKRRDTQAALKSLRRLLKNQRIEPESIITDGLKSYASATREIRLSESHDSDRLRENNQAEHSHLPIRQRKRKMLDFKSQTSAQRLLTTHAASSDTFEIQRHMISRRTLRIVRCTGGLRQDKSGGLGEIPGAAKTLAVAVKLSAPRAISFADFS